MLKKRCAILRPALSLWPVIVENTRTIRIVIVVSNAQIISAINLNNALKKFNFQLFKEAES